MRTPVLSLVALLLAAPAPAAPRPLAVWTAGPMEVRVVWDGPFDPAKVAELDGLRIAFDADGEPASIGIAAARLEDDGRTLVLFTDPHPRDATYRLPPLGEGLEAIEYRPRGVEVAWAEGEGDPIAEPSWKDWWPALDPTASHAEMAASAGHARRFADLVRPGRLSVRAFLALPAGRYVVGFHAASEFEATVDFEPLETSRGVGERPVRGEVAVEAIEGGEPIEVSLTIPTGVDGKAPDFAIWCRPEGFDVAVPPAGEWLVLPWVPSRFSTSAEAPAPPYALDGGDPVRGEAIFRGEESKCAACHKARGEGGVIGPDLSNLAGTDPALVYRHIAEPSARIHPEYVTYNVAASDGRVLVGIVRAEGADRLRVADIGGIETSLDRADVVEFQSSATSTMPVGLAGAIGEQGMRDLIAFLLAEPE